METLIIFTGYLEQKMLATKGSSITDIRFLGKKSRFGQTYVLLPLHGLLVFKILYLEEVEHSTQSSPLEQGGL